MTICSSCNGSGNVLSAKQISEKCSMCGGTGNTDNGKNCLHCSGGTITTEVYDKVPCKSCDGTGEVK